MTLSMVFIAALTSCGDDELSNAQPVVEVVRLVDAEDPITSAEFGQWIALIGNGLEGVSKVEFNGITAALSPVYVTNTSILVPVPGEEPINITDELILTTSLGKQTIVPFNVVVPGPSIFSVNKEFPTEGDMLTISGNNFFSVEKVVMPGGSEATVVEFDKEEIVIEVPGNLSSGPITVVTRFGQEESSFNIRDLTGVFLDFDSNPKCWGGENVISGESTDPPNIEGAFSLIQFTDLPPASFFPFPSVSALCGGIPALQVGGQSSDWVIKFEVNVQEAWSIGLYKIIFKSADDGDLEFYYNWQPWTQETKFLTDGWQTITIPLEDFQTRRPSAGFSDVDEVLPSVEKWIDFVSVFENGSAETIPAVKLSVDNFRAVKK